MKIGTTIHPKRGAHAHKGERHVNVADAIYIFRATTDKHGGTHYVTDVSNPDHAATLLAIDAYYVFDPAMQPKPTLVRGATETAPPPAPTPIDSPHTDAARKLLAESATGEKPPEVTCTSRGKPGFPASTRERPRETFF